MRDVAHMVGKMLPMEANRERYEQEQEVSVSDLASERASLDIPGHLERWILGKVED